MMTTPRSSVGANSLGNALNSTTAKSDMAADTPITNTGARSALSRVQRNPSFIATKKGSVMRTSRLSPSCARSSLEHIMGVSVSAISPENKTDAASAMPNSVNNRPVFPPMKDSGKKTETSTRVVAITAKAISRDPSREASNGSSPNSMRRWIFSSTTMASSTTRPMASTRPSSVSTFTENPNTAIGRKDATMETGMATAGMMVARTDRRNRKITPTTSASAIISACSTS